MSSAKGRLFVWRCATGITYCDRSRIKYHDYEASAHLSLYSGLDRHGVFKPVAGADPHIVEAARIHASGVLAEIRAKS